MARHYWQGSKSLPEDAGELIFTAVKFDTETESLVVIDETTRSADSVEEYIIDGIDDMWMVTMKLRSETTPVVLVDLGEINPDTNSYKIVGDKVLAKVRRFAKDRDALVEMKKLTNRTTY